MKLQYHREITTQAIGLYFDPLVLETVIAANLGQDALRYQFGHDHFHYDNNSFALADAYGLQLRAEIVQALREGQALPARQALGRLTHGIQDFYAHSNYVALWREHWPEAGPDEIDPLFLDCLSSSRLHSGRLYYPLEAFSFIPALKAFVKPLLPRDSHAWMNLDDRTCFNFEFAFTAAVKRTRLEYAQVVAGLSSAEVALLTHLASTP